MHIFGRLYAKENSKIYSKFFKCQRVVCKRKILKIIKKLNDLVNQKWSTGILGRMA